MSLSLKRRHFIEGLFSKDPLKVSLNVLLKVSLKVSSKRFFIINESLVLEGDTRSKKDQHSNGE